jgi:hypothetical protein
MEGTIHSIYVFMQIVLAPLLYPFGYLIQAGVILLYTWLKGSIRETELMLLEPIVLICLLCNTVMDDDISLAGYAIRLSFLLFRLYSSPRVQDVSKKMMDPWISVFLLFELIASPYLYPIGYVAQLAMILFLSFSGTIQNLSQETSNRKRKHYQEKQRLKKLSNVQSSSSSDSLHSTGTSKTSNENETAVNDPVSHLFVSFNSI